LLWCPLPCPQSKEWFVGSYGKHHSKSVVRLRTTLAAGIALIAAAAAGWATTATGVFSHRGARSVQNGADLAYQAQEPSAGPAPSSPLPTASPTKTPTETPAISAKPRKTKAVRHRPRQTSAHKVVGSGSCRASFYGEGQMTASGEAFDPGAMTAAHKSLPFGTRLRVTNKNNGESALVRINDRGPYISGRCLDLSTAAMRAVGGTGSGVIPVRYQILAMH
jgi:rare lipoprotein A (peptidoglycan hydrolase)